MVPVVRQGAIGWPWVGFVRSFFPNLVGRDLKFAVGSGAMIHPRILLTAGHVVYDREYGDAPLSVDVTLPGLGTFSGTGLPTNQWVNVDSATMSPVSAFDFAAVFLDAPVPNAPVVPVDLADDLSGTSITVVGYTGENYPRVPFYTGTATPTPSSEDGWRIAYPIATLPGMSGGPLYTIDSAIRPTIRGIHTSGPPGNALRITQSVLDLIKDWIKQG